MYISIYCRSFKSSDKSTARTRDPNNKNNTVQPELIDKKTRKKAKKNAKAVGGGVGNAERGWPVHL